MPTKPNAGRKSTRVAEFDPAALGRIRDALASYRNRYNLSWLAVAQAILHWDHIEEFVPGALEKADLPSATNAPDANWPVKEDQLFKWVKGAVRNGVRSFPTPQAPAPAVVAAFLSDKSSVYRAQIAGQDDGRLLQALLQKQLQPDYHDRSGNVWVGDFRAQLSAEREHLALSITITTDNDGALRVRRRRVETYPQDHPPIITADLSRSWTDEGWAVALEGGELLVFTRLLHSKMGSLAQYALHLLPDEAGVSLRWEASSRGIAPIIKYYSGSIDLNYLQVGDSYDYIMSRERRSQDDLLPYVMSASEFNKTNEFNIPRDIDQDLLASASRDDLDGFKAALDGGADINFQFTRMRFTTFQVAVEKKSEKVREYMMAHPDLNPTLEDGYGIQAWEIAWEAGDFHIADDIIDLCIAYRNIHPQPLPQTGPEPK